MKKKWKGKKKSNRVWTKVTESAINENVGLVARFDGACNPNPHGHASCACVITLDGEELHRENFYLGEGSHTSNNVAEFAGVVLILNWCVDTVNRRTLHIVGDSQIVIRRMRSSTLPDGICRSMASSALSRLGECKCEVLFYWQPRAKNAVCDQLAGDALPDDRPWGDAAVR